MRHTYLINYVLYQVGWFACVLGAAWGYPLAGFLIAALLIATHLWLAVERALELRLILLALVVGLLVEVVQHTTGTYRFVPAGLDGLGIDAGGTVPGVLVAGLPPLWLLALWAQLATTFRFSLRHVFERPWLSLAFGAFGGPLAFLAGERLGAIALLPPVSLGLLRLAVAWAIATSIFHLSLRRLSPGRHPTYLPRL